MKQTMNDVELMTRLGVRTYDPVKGLLVGVCKAKDLRKNRWLMKKIKELKNLESRGKIPPSLLYSNTLNFGMGLILGVAVVPVWLPQCSKFLLYTVLLIQAVILCVLIDGGETGNYKLWPKREELKKNKK